MSGNNTKTRIPETLWSNERLRLNAQIENKIKAYILSPYDFPKLGSLTKGTSYKTKYRKDN